MGIGLISFDMDSWWALSEVIGQKQTRQRDFIIRLSIPRILKILKSNKIKATFFVLGPDVESFPKLYKEIVEQGHEIGNHSFSHFNHLKEKNLKIIREEIKKTHDIIRDQLKINPIGFRAPNYNYDLKILKILQKMGYKYDSSIIASYFPGTYPLKWLLAPRQPYMVNERYSDGPRILEIPLSSHPLLRLPITGTGIRVFGLWILNSGLKFTDFLNINFHARDFVPEIPYNKNLSFTVYRNIKNCIQISNESIKLISRKLKSMRMDEFTYITHH